MGARLRHGTTRPRSGPDCTVGPRSGPDGPDRASIVPSGLRRAPDPGAIALSLIKLQGGILSKTGGEVGPEVFCEDSGSVWCCWGYLLSLFPVWRRVPRGKGFVLLGVA